jgi:predicted transcriptional regulator
VIQQQLIELGYDPKIVVRWARARSETLTESRRRILDVLLAGQATAREISDRVNLGETAVRWQLQRMGVLGWVSAPANNPASITLKGMRMLGYREPGVAG